MPLTRQSTDALNEIEWRIASSGAAQSRSPNCIRRRIALLPVLDREAAGDGRGHAVGQACWRAPWRAMSIPARAGRCIELGPGTGAGHRGAGRARRRSGAADAGRDSIRSSAGCCAGAIPTPRWSRATPIDLAALLGGLLREPAAAVVSGLPLLNQAAQQRAATDREAFALMPPDAPFVQFTYAMRVADPEAPRRRAAQASERSGGTSAGARLGLSQELIRQLLRRHDRRPASPIRSSAWPSS